MPGTAIVAQSEREFNTSTNMNIIFFCQFFQIMDNVLREKMSCTTRYNTFDENIVYPGPGRRKKEILPYKEDITRLRGYKTPAQTTAYPAEKPYQTIFPLQTHAPAFLHPILRR